MALWCSFNSDLIYHKEHKQETGGKFKGSQKETMKEHKYDRHFILIVRMRACDCTRNMSQM